MKVPTLHPEMATSFGGMGFGGLNEAQQIRVKWQLNGCFELTMHYPVAGRRWQDLKHRRIIVAEAGVDIPDQPFRIYRITAPLLGVATVYARHLAYDLMGYSVNAFAASNLAQACQQLQTGAAVQPHGFTISADFSSDVSLMTRTPRSVWSMLGGQAGSLLDVYSRGEWQFDGRSLTLRERIGADRGVIVRYGKNLRTLEQDENLANTWTAVHPYWQATDESVTVALPEKTISCGSYDYTRVLVLDLSSEWVEQPTAEQLRARAAQYIADNKVGIPDVGLDVSFTPLDQTEEFKGREFLTAVSAGDTVTVEFPTAIDRLTGAPADYIQASARVVEYTWLPLVHRYEMIRLGSKRANFVTAMVKTSKDVQWLMRKVVTK